MKVIPVIIGCLGGGVNELKANTNQIFHNMNDNKLSKVVREMQKTVLWESESIIKKKLSGLLI